MNIKLQGLTEKYKRHYSTSLDIGEHLKDQFDQLIESKNFYLYSENVIDKIDKHIIGNEYGDIFNNKIWLMLENKNNNTKYYGFVGSPILSPKMIDRIFFIDIMDRDASSELYDFMCLYYKEELECTWEGKERLINE